MAKNQAAGTKGSLEVKQEVRDALKAHRRFVILDYAQCTVNNAKVCRDFGVPRSAFHRWRKAYLAGGKAGLLRNKRMHSAIGDGFCLLNVLVNRLTGAASPHQSLSNVRP